MKNILRIAILVIGGFVVMQANGATVETEIDGIWYRLGNVGNTSPNYASVISPPENKYSQPSYHIPSYVTYNGEQYPVDMIEYRAFYNCTDVKEVIMDGVPQGMLDYISPYAFEGAGIERVVFPEAEVQVHVESFYGCENLDRIVFNSQETYLEVGFEGFPVSVEKIIFKGNSIIEPPATAYSHRDEDTEGSDNVAVPLWFDESLPVNANMTVEWGDGEHLVMSLDWFTGEVLTLSGRCKCWQRCATYGNVRHLYLEEVADRDEAYLCARMFNNCDNFETITCYDATPWPVDEDFLGDDSKFDTVHVYVPNGAVATYRQDPVWGRFAHISAITDSVESETLIDKAEDNAVPEYYNLQGVRVEQPQPGSVVICRQGNRVTKKVW
ncbi:MAG: leucine-rich repeat protein [Muribaculaceae bacterium]|nr:leucine-rich repeat protein [Muribaculaceae bacterium]